MNTEFSRIVSIAIDGKYTKYNGHIAAKSMAPLELGKQYKLHIVVSTGKIVAAELIDGVYKEVVNVIRVEIDVTGKYVVLESAAKNTAATMFKTAVAALNKPGKYNISYQWTGDAMPTIIDALAV